jgi:dGTPase
LSNTRDGFGLRTRAEREQEESLGSAAWATRSADSRGRLFEESEHPYRTVFQRDRDRVVHSTAFRRLQYKTQVFVYHEGDHYRNRLTHSLEGAQIARTLARTLRLNEDLSEAIALAHDLGHTPFGHAGERVLAELMKSDGGFDHNRQGLRVVDLLEQRHPDHAGLNLCDETREGMLKHGCRFDHPVRVPELLAQRSLEAQAADAADEIAYTNHDLDDALRSGLIAFDMLGELPLVGDVQREVNERFAGAPASVIRAQMIVMLINGLVTDLIESTHRRLVKCGIDGPRGVREADRKLVGFSDEIESAKRALKRFLYDHFYNHPRVAERIREAEAVVADLYRELRSRPAGLPAGVRERFGLEGEARAIGDYVAGMTDRFATTEHRRLLGSGPGFES